jgi:hypothetical protein
MSVNTPLSSKPPPPLRRYIHPEPGEGWEDVAARIPGADAATLQSWNLHLAMRPPPLSLTPIDIVFVEPPAPGGFVEPPAPDGN